MAFGPDSASSGFLIAERRGRCTPPCSRSQWSLSITDTQARDGGQALDESASPIVHRWNVSPPPQSQADCDAMAPAGASFDAINSACISSFVAGAVELDFGGPLNNDNGLCESNEACLITPHLGRGFDEGETTFVRTFSSVADPSLANVQLFARGAPTVQAR